MTNRDRIIRTLLAQPADRAPYGVGLGFSPWWQTLQRWREESGIADLQPHQHFGFDTGFAGVPIEAGPWPHFENRVIEETEEHVVSVDYRGIRMRNRRDGGSMPEWISHPVRTADDWHRYREERLQPQFEERLAGVEDFVEHVRDVDAPVQVGSFPWGVFGTARDLLGAEEVLIGFYECPDLIRDIMATYTGLWLDLWDRVAERVRIDHIHIWEDMSGRQGSLISMAMVEDFMMPHYDRIAEFARRRGIPLVSVDSDGLVDELVPVMMGHGINVFLPFEVQAGNDVEEYRRLYPTLGIIGGLDKNALARGREDVRRELDRAERMLAAGGFIPGFDHLIPPNASWDNFEYFCTELRKMIGA